MKSLLTIIILIFSIDCSGQNESLQLIEQTAQKVGIQNSHIFFRLATFQKFENGTIIVIPEIAEEGGGYMILKSNIILIDDKTGAVKAKFGGEKDWYIDAVSIDEIEIEPKLYQLNETTVVYGLKINYSNQSRPNPMSRIELSLFALEGIELKKILKDFPIQTWDGSTNGICTGSFEEHSKEMKVLNTHTNQYADLEFTDSIELSESTENCEKIRQETRKEVEILKFEKGEYKNAF